MQSDLIHSPAVVESVTLGSVTWVNVERPTSEEISTLADRFGVDRSDIEAAVRRTVGPSVRDKTGYVVLFAQVPVVASHRTERLWSPSPLGLFVGQDFVITVHLGEMRGVSRLFRTLQTGEEDGRGALPRDRTDLIVDVLDRLIEAIQPVHVRIGAGTREQEGLVGGRQARRAVREILHLRRDAREITRVTATLPDLITGLHLAVDAGAPSVVRQRWEQLGLRVARAVESARQDVESLDDLVVEANAAAAQRTVELLRFLTIAGVLTLPLLVIAGLFANPSDSPLLRGPLGFDLMLALAGIVLLALLFGLRRAGIV